MCTLSQDPTLFGTTMANTVSTFHHFNWSLVFLHILSSGLIRWGIVIHAFIDSYSRLITRIHASNNNLANTVLDLFLCASNVYGVLSRLRGDHGTENLAVAAWIEEHRGRF